MNNPARFFINGSKKREFTYEGGRYLYLFSPCDNKLSDSAEREILFFANSERHALDVLRRLFKFALRCYATYERYASKSGHEGTQWLGNSAVADFGGYLKALEAGTIKVSRAPRNQVYSFDGSDIG